MGAEERDAELHRIVKGTPLAGAAGVSIFGVRILLIGAVGAACGGRSSHGEVGALPTDAGPFADEATFACDPPLADVLSNLTPAVPVDYVALRTQSTVSAPGFGQTYPPEAKSSHGTACASASDQPKCLAALDALPCTVQSDGWLVSTGSTSASTTTIYECLVYTRGDAVGVLTNEEGIATFLAPIDTLEEARLVLRDALVCMVSPRTGWRRNADGSWEFLLGSPGGGSKGVRTPGWRERVVVSSDDGHVETLASQ
jgi:hypothetical protein